MRAAPVIEIGKEDRIGEVGEDRPGAGVGHQQVDAVDDVLARASGPRAGGRPGKAVAAAAKAHVGGDLAQFVAAGVERRGNDPGDSGTELHEGDVVALADAAAPVGVHDGFVHGVVVAAKAHRHVGCAVGAMRRGEHPAVGHQGARADVVRAADLEVQETHRRVVVGEVPVAGIRFPVKNDSSLSCGRGKAARQNSSDQQHPRAQQAADAPGPRPRESRRTA